ncbi:MAG TPA: nuclear transport factor 2 family protein [Cyclobacteriaceae bacterium]|nr:nuclear transport factor 2 family protein [Cyclobacteriaceae bacterium]HRX01023.1 nuclear transport factor 2 family protein [Cyclobacteriaceae bacterium]
MVLHKRLLLLGMVALGACQQSVREIQTVVTEQDTKTLRYLKEVEWAKAYREQDTVLLDRILGHDFQMIDDRGVWSDKEGELEWIRHNAMVNDTFYYEIKRLDVLDNGTAMICGTGHIWSDSIETVYQSSNVLVKRDGIWKAISSHVSGVKEAH